jgi:hypothetical protein
MHPSLCRALLVACSLFPLGGCLVTTTAPPADPNALGVLPGANVSAREQVVLAQLQTIKQAELAYFAEKGRFGTVDELVSSGQLNHTPQVLNYTIEIEATAGGYTLMAVPDEYGPDGRRSFYLDQSGIIRGADHNGGAPKPTDPPV